MSFSSEIKAYAGARFSDTDFTDASLTGFTFQKCDFRGAVLSGPKLLLLHLPKHRHQIGRAHV